MTDKQAILDRYQRYVIPTYAQSLLLVRGKGSRVWDADGQVYLDFTSGIAVLNLGHCHPRVTDAMARQAASLGHVSNLFYNENQALLAEQLSSLSLQGKCFFCNSGAEANEALIKLARLRGHDAGRYQVISMVSSFHGRTLATAAATGQAKIQKGFEPMPEGFVQVPFNDLDAVKAACTPQTAAVLLEVVQGEGGVVSADAAFLQGLREYCDQQDILMLCDEVQCGMGRTGSWFGFQSAGVSPDAFSLAKALGNGFPIGAIVTNPRVADVFQAGKHASTFGGTPLACAAALATTGVIADDGLVDRAAARGAEITSSLQALQAKYDCIQEVRGRGFMIGLALDRPVKPLCDALAAAGLLTIATGESVIRFYPPLNTPDAEIEEALEILDETIEEWLAPEAPPAEAVASDEAESESEPEAETESEPEAGTEGETESGSEPEGAGQPGDDTPSATA